MPELVIAVAKSPDNPTKEFQMIAALLTAKISTTTEDAAPVRLAEHERQRCEVWTRVMGYHRPVASFNTGKKGEFLERRHFEETACGRAAAARVDVTA
jgi:hypothetical protein